MYVLLRNNVHVALLLHARVHIKPFFHIFAAEKYKTVDLWKRSKQR